MSGEDPDPPGAPTATLAELGERGMQVDYRTVWEFVHAEGLTHKKSP